VKKDIKMVGISIDGESGAWEAQRFIARHKLNYPNLIGDARTVGALYKEKTGESFRATLTFMVFDPDGKLRSTQAGGIPPDVIEQFIESNS
jgi:peroxiredoxin